MGYLQTYVGLKARLAPFKLLDGFEYEKTTAAIDALLDRAEVIASGGAAGGRFHCMDGMNVENLTQRAVSYLEALERGELPLKGKFAQPGEALIDHSFVVTGEEIHLFYNRQLVGYEWAERIVDTFGHAVTRDLVHWRIEKPALSMSPASYENYQIWSPGVIEHDGLYYLFYTGVNYSVAQSICLAVSSDLYHWEKAADNPVYRPGSWSPWREDAFSDCRDPMVFRDDDGTFYLYTCTARYADDGTVKTAVGVARSRDLFHWEDVNVFSLPHCEYSPESPFVLKRNGTYYLFYTSCNVGTCYATSTHPADGWTERGELIANPGHAGSTAHVPSCSEVFSFRGQWYISYAERLLGNEQYLQLRELYWNDDGTCSLGKEIGI